MSLPSASLFLFRRSEFASRHGFNRAAKPPKKLSSRTRSRPLPAAFWRVRDLLFAVTQPGAPYAVLRLGSSSSCQGTVSTVPQRHNRDRLQPLPHPCGFGSCKGGSWVNH